MNSTTADAKDASQADQAPGDLVGQLIPTTTATTALVTAHPHRAGSNERQRCSSAKSCQSHPNKRVLLSESQIRFIAETAQSTGNKYVINTVSKTLSRSFAVKKRSKPKCPPPAEPDPELAARVETLRKHAIELGAKLFEVRATAPKKIRDHMIAERTKSAARFINLPAPLTSPQTQRQQKIPPAVESSMQRLTAISTEIKKTQKTAADAVLRVNNARIVLQKLKEDAAVNNCEQDVSQTIDADWTINVNPSSNKNKRTKKSFSATSAAQSISSPIPARPPRNSDDLEALSLSPFVTPRSKVRRRTARFLNDVPGPRFGMPR